MWDNFSIYSSIRRFPDVRTPLYELCILTDDYKHRMTSILTCHFMLSLRQFDSAIASTTGPQLREHTASTVLQFGAQPSDSLPATIASFAHPIYLGSHTSDVDTHTMADNVSEGQKTNVGALGQLEGVSRHSHPV